MEEIGEIKIDFLWLHDQGGRTNLKTAIILFDIYEEDGKVIIWFIFLLKRYKYDQKCLLTESYVEREINLILFDIYEEDGKITIWFIFLLKRYKYDQKCLLTESYVEREINLILFDII